MAYEDTQIVEIVCGREALWGLRNSNLKPVGSLITFRNATLEDQSWRTGGGASILGSAIAALTIQAALDYFPDTATQRTLVSCDDGTLRKDNGSGASWSTLASGLTTANQVPCWLIAGAEQSGNNRKAIHFDRVNAPQVLSGDAASMAALSAPPADWSGSNQPGFGFLADGYHFAGGNANDGHRLYRSIRLNHEDFLSIPYSLSIHPNEGDRLAAGLPYKGGALVWKSGRGGRVYFIDMSNESDAAWRAYPVGPIGCEGPYNVYAVEDDVLWIASDGTWHLISATQATGSVRASDLTYRKLGSWARDNINLSRLAWAQMIYYSNKAEIQLACSATGQTAKGRRLHLDLGRKTEVGERWLWWDADRNEALFLRRKSGVDIPAMGDNAGQIWELDQTTRNRNGSAYTFEWFLSDTDFSPLIPEWRGRKKNLRFIQLEYDPRGTASHSVDIYRDGSKRQTVSFSLTGGPAALPQVLPVTLGVDVPKLTPRKRAKGQCTRFAARGISTGVNEDVSLLRILIGLELAA